MSKPLSLRTNTPTRMTGRTRGKDNPRLRDEAPPGMADLTQMAGSVGFIIRIVQLQLFQAFYQDFEGRGLSLGAMTTLSAIRANPGIRHGVLADALLIKRPNFTKVINRLERAGLIERHAPHSDKRATALYLTVKGRRKIDALSDMVRQHDERMTASLEPGEREALLELLRKMSSHLRNNLGAPGLPSGDL